MDNLSIVDHFSTFFSGDIVECGTWKGGMACGMMAVCGSGKKYHFFDSFEGLPPPRDIDGGAAMSLHQKPYYYNNNRADYDEFCQLVYAQSVPRENISIYKGWFSDTLRQYSGGPISVLRLDGDWYDSTMQCLRGLWDLVEPGGVVIIDDYIAFSGCSRAVHDFLSSISSISRISRTPRTEVAYIWKCDGAYAP
ncbi:TylF/MycF/NovP-related O-methyltransferase [Magnetospirillum sp. ME-1]|uniref:TylF/MycF/NovP-related O-methyltransferase n=1 Tax=Magnetospirillum sp. ME-1 TaxID=1639348 RepID=UPI00143D0FE9|nr:TylF/MycF/NovP-related O-methyltransferase [Magnetospirillum sp. ME-1]